MGSILVGDNDVIQRARRARKSFGGALRQAGIIAAAAQYALENHRDQLADDHRNAYRFAEEISQVPGLTVPFNEVETNIVFIKVSEELGTAEEIATRFAALVLKMYDIGPQRIRAVFHRDIDADMTEQAAKIVQQAIAAAV